MKAFIEYLIKKYLPGYHLAKNPTRKQKVASERYPTHEE